jgi:hypothetical protein
MIESLALKSFITSALTSILTEALNIYLIYINLDLNKILVISLIFSYILVYIAQRYVFRGGRFFGISFLKYWSVALVVIQLTNIFLEKLKNIKFVKNLIEDETISNTRRQIYEYIILNTSIIVLFIFVQYPLRLNFIFVKNPNDYVYSYILYMIGIMIYICFDGKYFLEL